MVVCAWHPSDGGRFKIGSWSRLTWVKSKNLISKITRAKRVWLKWYGAAFFRGRGDSFQFIAWRSYTGWVKNSPQVVISF
jgi:hypothetical protein